MMQGVMSGRFANLEFDAGEQGERQAAEQHTLGKTAHDFLAQAYAESRCGRYEPALRSYTRALREDRAVIPAWVGQVQMLVQLGEYHEARVWSDKALELFRNNGELLAAKAQACVRLEDGKAALACSDASLAAAGSSALRWIVRGEVLLAAEEPHSEDCFQKALSESAADWFDRVMIARVYMFYERFTNAMCYLKEAIEREPTQGYTWFELGNCQRVLALEAAARTSYQRCLELRPDYREADRVLLEMAAATPFLSRLRGLFRRWSGR